MAVLLFGLNWWLLDFFVLLLIVPFALGLKRSIKESVEPKWIWWALALLLHLAQPYTCILSLPILFYVQHLSIKKKEKWHNA